MLCNLHCFDVKYSIMNQKTHIAEVPAKKKYRTAVTVHMTDDQYDWLYAKADANCRSVSAQLRYLVSKAMEDETKQRNEDCLASQQ